MVGRRNAKEGTVPVLGVVATRVEGFQPVGEKWPRGLQQGPIVELLHVVGDRFEVKLLSHLRSGIQIDTRDEQMATGCDETHQIANACRSLGMVHANQDVVGDD